MQSDESSNRAGPSDAPNEQAGDQSLIPNKPKVMDMGKEFFAVFGGKHSGVYTTMQKATFASRSGGTLRVYTDLESAMKFAQLGFDAESKTFAPPTLKDIFVKNPDGFWVDKLFGVNKMICMAYVRAEDGKLGFHVTAERTTFIRESFDHENETVAYLDAVLHITDMVLGLRPEDHGGLLDPEVDSLVIVLPTRAPIKWLSQPKSPLRPVVKAVLDVMEVMPVALMADPFMCQINVGFSKPEDPEGNPKEREEEDPKGKGKNKNK